MKKLRILVVDDDTDFAEGLVDLFEMAGKFVERASDGEAAIELVNRRHYDLVFMDVRLPGMSGVESFLQIRRISPAARVVLMTGYSVEDELEVARNHGAYDVLYKPLNMEAVLEMVEQVDPSYVVLVSDDDSEFSDGLQALLEEHGYAAYLASNGEEALQRVLANGIDVLILDLRMPVKGGAQVYLELRDMGWNLPALVVTGYADEEHEDIARLREHDVDGILTKPLDHSALLESVGRLCGRR